MFKRLITGIKENINESVTTDHTSGQIKITSKWLQTTKAADHLLKFSVYGNKDKSLYMVNDTKMTSIS